MNGGSWNAPKSLSVNEVYATRDGHLVLSMSPLGALARALPLPALEPYAAVTWNFEAREAVARLIEPAIRERTTAEWIERFEASARKSNVERVL